MEASVRQRFRKEIGRILSSGHIRYDDSTFLNTFSDEEVPASYVFHPAEVFRIVGNVDGTFIVAKNAYWFAATFA